MRLTVDRRTSEHRGERIEFNGWLHAEIFHARGQDPIGFLRFGFDTDKPLGASQFSAAIEAIHFDQLALEMMKADPEAAVRAFGTALQQVHAVRPSKPKPVAKPISATQTSTTAAA